VFPLWPSRFFPSKRRAARSPGRAASLAVEVLEDRTLLTTAPVLPGTLFAAQTYDGNGFTRAGIPVLEWRVGCDTSAQ